MQGSARSTIVIWLLAAALAVAACVRLLGGGSDAPAVRIDGGRAGASGAGDWSAAGGLGGASGGAGAAPAASGSGAAPAASGGGELFVHVAGAVRNPGLIRLPAGTRVATALERAGGPTRRADLTLVNLAARVQDGQQIVVPVAGASAGAATSGAAASGTGAPPGSQIHLSSATADQLDEVDGIGPTLAERIVEYRDAHGGFRSLDELAEVDGIGEKRLTTLRAALQP